jgi:putative cell wall-binding protein
MVLKSKLELFAAFKQLDVIIVRSDNTIAAKVNEYISVNLNVQLINDRVVSTRTQVKQTIAFGFSYVLI